MNELNLIFIDRMRPRSVVAFSLFHNGGWSCIRNFESFSIFPVKTISLKSFKGNCALNFIFIINKTVVVFSTDFRHLWNESCRKKTRIRSKYMSHFSFSRIGRNSINVKTTRGFIWNLEQTKRIMRL